MNKTTIQVLKQDSALEKRVQQVEEFMNKLNVKLQYTYHGLTIVDVQTNKSYPLVDTESQDESQTEFPRMIDNIRLRVRENENNSNDR